MKKCIALILVLLLCSLSMGTALADKLDFSYVQANPEAYDLDMDDEDDLCFITTTLSSRDRHYSHDLESDHYWSTTQFDVICLNLDSSSPYPVWRLWVSYSSEIRYINLHSVTFILHGRSYTFTDVSDPEWVRQKEGTYMEEILIKFGTDSAAFIAELKKYAKELTDIADFSCTMILHGDEDLTVTLGESFLLDFMLIDTAFMKMDGLDAFDRFICTPMTIR